jgi:hypothetical protein
MKKLIFGILLCVAGFAVPTALLVPLILGLRNDTVVFKAPAEVEVRVEEAGRYYVWNEYRTLYEGRTYAQSKSLPSGMTFSLTDPETGEELPFAADFSISSTTGEREKMSVGYFDIEDPGAYLLRIQGLEEPRIFSFGPSIFDDFFAFFGRLLLAFALGCAALVGGILLIVFGIIETVRKGRNPSLASGADGPQG